MICPGCKEQMTLLSKGGPLCGDVLNGNGDHALLVVLLIAGTLSGAFAAGQNLIIIINGLILLLAAATRCKAGSSRV